MPGVTLDIVTKIAGLNIQRSYTHLLQFFGFDAEVRVPNTTRMALDMYGKEDDNRNYNTNPDFMSRVLPTGIDYMNRFLSTTVMDNEDMEPKAYSKDKRIVADSLLTFNFQNKKFEFRVDDIVVLELGNVEDNEIIRTFKLIPVV
jgi:hypothetical protein